jgi:hypothetical protein
MRWKGRVGVRTTVRVRVRVRGKSGGMDRVKYGWGREVEGERGRYKRAISRTREACLPSERSSCNV